MLKDGERLEVDRRIDLESRGLIIFVRISYLWNQSLKGYCQRLRFVNGFGKDGSKASGPVMPTGIR